MYRLRVASLVSQYLFDQESNLSWASMAKSGWIVMIIIERNGDRV